MILAALTAWAAPGSEIVVVLDNSCSMVEPHTRKGSDDTFPAADPERRAVLGAQFVSALAKGKDRVTVLGFPVSPGGSLIVSDSPDAIREIPASSGTYFREPLKRAHEILTQSDRDDRLLLFLSDGDPNDLQQPAEGRALLGLDEAEVPFDTLVLGLFPGENPRAEGFLKELALGTDDYVRVRDGADLVSEFTTAYAHSLGSKAISGTLKPGQPARFMVGKYVTEVLAVTTSLHPDGPFEAVLSRKTTPQAATARGDNGCSRGTRRNPDLCKPPRLHFQTWRMDNDPKRKTPWELQLEQGSEVAYGVILRYDLWAKGTVSKAVETNKTVPITGRLTWNRETFTDTEFFEKDGFHAEAIADGVRIPMEHVGDGVFKAMWTPTRIGRNDVVVRFANQWMEKRDRTRVRVAPDKPLTLSSQVDAIDFGHWSGARTSTERCVDLGVEANRELEPDSLSYAFEGAPKGLLLSVTTSEGTVHACARAKGCCGDIEASGAKMIVTANAHGESATTAIPVKALVDRTGFLACWWPWLCGLLTLLLLLLFLYGWIRPHDFEEGLRIKVGGSDRQLNRAAALVLREQPGGRRGFYRNARIALTGGGDFVRSPKSAAVWIEAVGHEETEIHPRSTVEIQDARSKKWVTLTEEQAADGLRTHTLYRVGDILFRFE